MSQNLTNAIVNHIFNNLGILTNSNVVHSIINSKFLTKHKIMFTDIQGKEELASVWACQTVVNNSKFRIMCVKFICSHTSEPDDDSAIIIELEDCPMYGCMIAEYYSEVSDAFIGCKLDNKNWIPTTPFIQATFLAGMEQLRYLSTPFEIISDTDALFEEIKDFIVYRNSLLEDNNAGQED